MISRVLTILFLHQSSVNRNLGEPFSLLDVVRKLLSVIQCICIVTASLIALYYALSSPPMHFIYDVAPPAGPSSIYVPGGGFAGFWFHLGFLHSIENLHDYDYYCFSSGCLGALAVLMNRTLDETADAAFHSQRMWHSGIVSRFDLVEHFLDGLVPTDVVSLRTMERILPNLKILVTTAKSGHEVLVARSRDELADLLVKTTWVPYLTGWGVLSDDEEAYFDGGFSRLLHPKCEVRLDLPIIWETIMHTFSPGITREQVGELWQAGHRHDYSLPKKLHSHEMLPILDKSLPSVDESPW